MTVQPAIDRGQELPKPAGRVVGFVDTQEQFEAVSKALLQAKYPESTIIALHGPDGIDMLKRQRETFQFGDGENAIEEFALNELRAGHYAIAVEVENRADAIRVMNWTQPLGGHSYMYLGNWVNERLTK